MRLVSPLGVVELALVAVPGRISNMNISSVWLFQKITGDSKWYKIKYTNCLHNGTTFTYVHFFPYGHGCWSRATAPGPNMAGLDGAATFFFRKCSKDGPFRPSGSSGGMNLFVKSYYNNIITTSDIQCSGFHPLARNVLLRLFAKKLQGPAWAVGSYSIGPPAKGSFQILIFKTLRTSE